MDGTAKDGHPHHPTPQEVIYKLREWDGNEYENPGLRAPVLVSSVLGT